MRRLLITSKRWTQPTRPSQMTGRSARCGLSLPCTRTWPQKDRSTEPCHSAAVPGKHSAKGKTPQQPQEATDSGTPIVCSVNNTYWFPGTRKGERHSRRGDYRAHELPLNKGAAVGATNQRNQPGEQPDLLQSQRS